MNLDQEDLQEDLETEGQDDLYEHHRIVIDPGQSLLRIDKFLIDRLPNVSRNRIQTAAKAGTILVDGKAVKPSFRVKPGQVVSVVMAHPPREKVLLAEDLSLNIIYEDQDLLLVNKSAGMVVHPAYGHYSGTLVNGLVYHFKQLPTGRNGEIRPGLVHRIDKDTSGLLVIAKNEEAMTLLAAQFFNHSIEREYYALVWGDMPQESGTITGNIDRSIKDRKVRAVYPDGTKGKRAVTHYRVIKRWGFVTLCAFNLETGRTHQIRVHCQFIGHPIFADPIYGGDKIRFGNPVGSYKKFVDNLLVEMGRLALHARTLGFIHPANKDFIRFEAPLPDDFTQLLNRWDVYISGLKTNG